MDRTKYSRNNYIYLAIIIAIMTIIMYGLKDHISLDTFCIIKYGYSKYASEIFLSAGRPLSAILLYIADFFSMKITTVVNIYLTLAIVISSISVIVLKDKIKCILDSDNQKSEIILLMLSFTMIFNFMYLEYFLFIECPIMCLGTLLAIIVAYKLIIKASAKEFSQIIILGVLSIFCYQGTLNEIIIFCMLFSIIHNKNGYKKIFIDIVKCAILSIILLLFNYIAIKISVGEVQGRLSTIGNIILNIEYIITNIPSILLNTLSLFPEKLFLLYVMLTIVVGYINCIKNKQVSDMLPIIIFSIFSIASAFIQHIITLSSFGSGRLLFPIGMMIGGILTIAYINFYRYNSKILKLFYVSILISYICALMFSYLNVIKAHNLTNKIDQNNIKLVNHWIKEYEFKNDKKVTKLGFLYDSTPNKTYENVRSKSSFSNRALWANISIVGSINYYTGRNLIKVPVKLKIYNEYFKDKNWNKLSREQLVFIDDTLYFCVY
ncbi:MAG: glucosyltransferase domain-containing protein [Bacillota bacterium]|nr:glucosyltransferase domain-containing protein [Bacillota bacterium]